MKRTLERILLLTLILLICLSCFGLAEAGHEWKETWYVGGNIGINSFNDDDGYFAGVMGFYHTQLAHTHPRMLSDYISQYGIIGTGNYLREPGSDLALTLQYSKGLWLDQTALLQLAAGPLWSESYGWGASSILLLSYKYSFSEDNFNTGALFIQSDGYFDDSERAQFRFLVGISLGIGQLIEVND